MFVLTIVNNNVIISITRSIELEKVLNGEYVSATIKDYEYVYDTDSRTYYPKDMINYHQIDEVQENVEASKYCYTEEKGFYENLNYEEPQDPIDVEATIREQQEIIAKQQEHINAMQEALDFIIMS